MKAWDVYYNGELIDTVYFIKSMTAIEVYQSLVGHDGYPSNITVELGA